MQIEQLALTLSLPLEGEGGGGGERYAPCDGESLDDQMGSDIDSHHRYFIGFLL